jgi:hypothetical protein
MDDAAFFATATDVINDLERELRRACPEARSGLRALELGSGSGRLMRTMSRHFTEIRGYERLESRILESRERLRDVPNARVYQANGAFVREVADGSIHFAYSAGDFAESGGRDAALELLRELRRVLAADGIARLRFTGQAPGSDALFAASELLEIAAANDFQVLSLEGAGTRLLWTTWRRQPVGWSKALEDQATAPEESRVVIRRITNASSTEPVAPCRGRFASVLVYAEDLPSDAGLGHLRVTIGTSFGIVTGIGPADRSGWQPIRVELPELEETGLLPVRVLWFDRPISAPVTLRVIPPGPMVPRVVSMRDARNPLARHRIESRSVKMVLEEIARPDEVQAFVGGMPAWDIEYTCINPRERRYELNFHLPDDIGPGAYTLDIRAGGRKLAGMPIEVA